MQIEIKKPCAENWNQMTPTNQGKFCHSCNQEVLDFTKMSKEEIQNYFKNSCKEGVCGRFNEDQLYVKPSFISKIKYAAILILGFCIPTACNKKTKGEFITADTTYVSTDKVPTENKDSLKNCEKDSSKVNRPVLMGKPMSK